MGRFKVMFFYRLPHTSDLLQNQTNRELVDYPDPPGYLDQRQGYQVPVVDGNAICFFFPHCIVLNYSRSVVVSYVEQCNLYKEKRGLLLPRVFKTVILFS